MLSLIIFFGSVFLATHLAQKMWVRKNQQRTNAQRTTHGVQLVTNGGPTKKGRDTDEDERPAPG